MRLPSVGVKVVVAPFVLVRNEVNVRKAVGNYGIAIHDLGHLGTGRAPRAIANYPWLVVARISTGPRPAEVVYEERCGNDQSNHVRVLLGRGAFEDIAVGRSERFAWD
jgi:hypothetical protein